VVIEISVLDVVVVGISQEIAKNLKLTTETTDVEVAQDEVEVVEDLVKNATNVADLDTLHVTAKKRM